jgi:signal transduction histidine kinase
VFVDSDRERVPAQLPGWSGPATFTALAVFVGVGVALRLPAQPALVGLGAAVALSAGWAATWRPGKLVLLWAVVAGGGVVALGNGEPSNVGWFALCLLGWACALQVSRRSIVGFWAAALAALLIEGLAVKPDPGWFPWVAGVSISILGALLARHELELVATLRAAQAELSERARAEERARIAREVHDVVAHSLTVVLLHLSSGRLAASLDPASAERALGEAEELTRQSLEQVRQAVAGLRADQDGASETPTRPLPTLADLPDLVARLRAAGSRVRLTADDPAPVPATTGLAVYRIAQEALTNATKHAPACDVTVDVAVGASAVDLRIDSAGSPGQGRGLGLIGMRERAEALGGSLEAGPGGSGWVVHARLPLPSAEGARPVVP